MCGICGLVYDDPARPVEPARLDRMTDILRHRGPDGRGIFRAPGVGLGFRRLAIVDLDTGDQPLANEDASLQLVCNGEIYNAPELRRELMNRGHRFSSRSDVEVILHLYEELGDRCVERLRGMFAFALWDSRQRRLLLVRDRFGIKPLYYARTAEGLLFGSEYKSIIAAGGVPLDVDPHALAELFTVMNVNAPRTMLRAVRSLPSANTLSYRSGRLELTPYWDPTFPPAHRTSQRRAGELAEELRALLSDSVRMHMRSDVEVGAWLSGGLDSTAVARLAIDHRSEPLRTFSLAFEDAAVDEIRRGPLLTDDARLPLRSSIHVCGQEHFDRYPEVLWHGEDPGPSLIDVARKALSDHTARSVKVVLTGEGSDEIFCGYHWYTTDKLTRAASVLPAWLRRYLGTRPGYQQRRLNTARGMIEAPPPGYRRYTVLSSMSSCLEGHPELLSPELRAALAAAPPADTITPPPDFARWQPLAQLQYFDQRHRLASGIVRHLDRGAMAASLETRVPFLDYPLVDWAARLPQTLKVRGRNEKYILRRAMAPLLPTALAARRKYPMTAPAVSWLRAPLAEANAAQLSERALRDKGYFEPRAVLELLARHRGGREDHSHALGVVLGVQTWDELFLRRFDAEEAARAS